MKSKLLCVLAAPVFAILIQGCATVHPCPWARTEDSAIVVVYRGDPFGKTPKFMEIPAVVSIDNASVVKLLEQEYAEISCPPGIHRLSVYEDATLGKTTASFEVNAKEKKCFRISLNSPARNIAGILFIPAIPLGLVHSFDLEETGEEPMKAVVSSAEKKKIRYKIQSNHKDGHGP